MMVATYIHIQSYLYIYIYIYKIHITLHTRSPGTMPIGELTSSAKDKELKMSSERPFVARTAELAARQPTCGADLGRVLPTCRHFDSGIDDI